MGIQDDLLQDQVDERDNKRLSMTVNDQDSARSARVLEMQMQTGLPVDLIERNLDDVEAKARVKNFDPDQFRKNSPIFARWAAENPHHPAVINDDYENLSGIEWAGKAFMGAHKSGWATIEQAEIGNRIIDGTATPADRDRLATLKEQYPDTDFGAEHWYSRLITETGRQLPNMEYVFSKGAAVGLGGASVGAVAGTMAGPGAPLTVPATAAVGYGVGQVTGSFQAAQTLERGMMALELMDIKDENGQPLPDPVIRTAADMVGVVNASLELVGLGAIGKHLGGEKLMRKISQDAVKEALKKKTFRDAILRFGGRYAESVGTEVVTETLQETSNIIADELAKSMADGNFKGTNAKEVADRLSEIAVRTLEGTALIGGVGPSARLTTEVAQVRQANERKAIFEALGEKSRDSKLRARLPAKFREYVQRLRENGAVDKIRIPIDRFNEYFQSQSLDPAAAAEGITGSPTAYAEAYGAGTDLEISLEDFADKVAPNHLDGLIDDLRIRPDDMTAREARQWTENADTLIQELSGEIDTSKINQDVYDDVIGQLIGTGMDRSAAEQNALLMSSVFETLGQRTGTEPMELYRRYGLSITQELPAILRDVTDFNTQVDPLIDRLRSGDIPTDEQAFGQSLIDFVKSKGGLQDQGGELAARDAGKQVRGLVKSGGMTLDEAAGLAFDAGYISSHDATAFMDALDRSLAGEHVAPETGGDQGLRELRGALDDLGRYLDELHVDLSTVDNAAVRKLLTDGQTLNQLQPEEFSVEPIAEGTQFIIRGREGDNTVGQMRVDNRADRVQISTTEVAASRRSEGIGRQLLEQASDLAKREGKPLVSDTTVSALQLRVYESLKRRGWTIEYSDPAAVKDMLDLADRAEKAGKPISALGVASKDENPVVSRIEAPETYQQSSGEGDTAAFKTGQPVEFRYARNTESATKMFGVPDKESPFDRGYEPSGRYMVQIGLNQDSNLETGMIRFRNPLVMDVGEYGTETSWKRKLSQQYDGKTGKALSEALVKDGYDGVVTIDRDHTSEILDLTEFDPSISLYQSGKDLFVAHNLTGANILHAKRMGGIPVPSLAVASIEKGGFGNFGEITLIADPSFIDPKVNGYVQTFNSDVYSPRYPNVQFDISQSDIDKVWKEFGDTYKLFGSHISSYIDRSELSRGLSPILESEAIQFQWLKETGNGVKPVPEKRADLSEYGLTEADAKQWGNEHYVDAQQLMRDPDFQAVVRAGYIRNLDSKELSNVDRQYLIDIFDEGRNLQNLAHKAAIRIGKWWEWKPGKIDEWATKNKVRDKMTTKRREQYEKWVKEKFEHMLGQGKIVTETRGGNRKTMPHTLDNVVSIMSRNVRGGEGFNYGVGNVRSKVAKKFSSLSAIQKDRDKIIASEEFQALKDETQDRFISILEALKPYYRYQSSGFGYMDDASMSVGEYAVRKYGLRDFKEVPAHIIEEIDDFLAELKVMPTEYFESHVSRAVEVSEFAGAVVPRNADKKVIDYLKEQGLKIRYYKEGDNADRIRATKGFKRQFFQSDKTGPRASININQATRQIAINLSQASDLSSFLHESGHFYLEVLGDLAESADAPEQITQDYAAILKWLGVENRQGITRDQHEQFARGFEAYLREGKAPSVELQNAFARFKAWLTAIYRRLSALNVELDDSIRAVFDRLVATDDAIANAQESQNYVALFTNSNDAGMTDEQFAVYRKRVEQARIDAEESLTQKLLRVLTREQKKWWKAEREKVRERVASEVHKMRVYRALSFLQRGEAPDGTTLDMTHVKLSRDELLATYGKDFLKRLPRPYVYQAKDGVSADEMAALFGYRSGDEMVQELVNARNMKRLIEAETDARMKAMHPDPMQSGELTEQAMKAVHNDKRAELLAAELRTLRRLANADKAAVSAARRADARQNREARAANRGILPNADDLKLIKLAAARMIGEKRVRDITPATYRTAEAKAARKAFEANGKGDYQTAYLEKRKQILNHELYRAASKAKDRIEKIVNYAQRIGKSSAQQRLGTSGHLEQIQGILERYDFSRITNIASKKRVALAEWVQQQRDAGQEINVPDHILNEAERTPYKELSFDEIEGIYDVLKNIAHLSTLKNKLLAAQDKRDFNAAVLGVVNSIDDNHERKKEPIDFAGHFRSTIKTGVKKLFAEHTKMEFLFTWLDGEKELGPVWEALFKPLADAENAEQVMQRDARKNMERIFSKNKRSATARFWTRRIHVDEVDASFTKASLLSVALNVGNTYNREALMRGYGWNEMQLRAVLEKLDDADWEMVEEIWTWVNSYWPEIAKLQKELTGVSPKKVEGTPFITPSGRSMPGGYYPISYDSKTSERQLKQDEKMAVDEQYGGHFARVSTRQGHTKERVGSGGKQIKLDLSVLSNHVTNVIHDLTHRKAIYDVRRLIESERIQSAIIETAGREMYRQLTPWLRNIAADFRAPMNSIEAFLNRARSGTTVVNMGLKITTMVVQPLGYLQTIDLIGAKYAAIGLKKFYGDGVPYTSQKRALDFAMERSEQLRNRMQTFDRDIRDQLKGVSQNRHNLRRAWFYTVGLLDMSTSVPTWLGAYQKSMDGAVEGVPAGDEQKAIDYADSALRRSQAAGGAKDMAGIQTGHPLMKLFTLFYTYFNSLFNLLQRSARKTNFKSPKDIAKFTASMFYLWFVPAILSEIIAGRGPDDDEDPEDWAKRTFYIWGLYPFYSVVGVRDIVNALGPFGYEGSPAFAAVGELSKALLIPYKAFHPDEELDRADAKNLVMAASYWGALPGRQAWITGSYLYDWATGEEQPEDIQEVLKGLSFSRRK